ncbi:MAG: SAM-dependent methyltransferase [Lewinella sp.]|uniref:SAM-dependent methyltransferase n=1 Tax=Lewinella sp. TaxID=2004506 RepID=UPI003D6C2E43
MKELDAEYWEKRWIDQQTGWDIGQASPPLTHYLNENNYQQSRILIPGAGRAYEAIYLHQQGYQNVFVCDWAPSAFDHLRQIAPDFPEEHLLVGNFFELETEVPFDLLLEQTFFCAIDPALRPQYVTQAANLLGDQGRLAGVLFAKEFSFPGPPFGGVAEDYRKLFAPSFEIMSLEITPYSIAPRLGNELFIELKKH